MTTRYPKPHKKRALAPGRGYAAGRKLEWKVRDQLRADGWEVVRAAGSHTPADLVAMKPGPGICTLVQLVQIKRTAWPSPADREALSEMACRTNAVPVIWREGSFYDRPQWPPIRERSTAPSAESR